MYPAKDSLIMQFFESDHSTTMLLNKNANIRYSYPSRGGVKKKTCQFENGKFKLRYLLICFMNALFLFSHLIEKQVGIRQVLHFLLLITFHEGKEKIPFIPYLHCLVTSL